MKRSVMPVLFVALAFLSPTVHADVGLPAIFADNMVLQREMPIPVWGWASPDEKIEVAFNGQKQSATTDADGRWTVRLAAEKASSEGRELTVTGKNSRVFKNVVVGEVWICSGQSNMEWQMRAFDSKTAKECNDPDLRYMRVRQFESFFPTADFILERRWTPCEKGSAEFCTATGFFFARRLRQELGVPVGLIDDAWGGSSIDSWIPACGWEAIPKLQGRFNPYKAKLRELEKQIGEYADYVEGKNPQWVAPIKSNIDRTGQMFNQMVNPCIPYALRGLIWYQGESSAGDGENYRYKLEGLIAGWRKLWNQGDFSFYYVQLPNFGMGGGDGAEGNPNGWPKIRDGQRKALSIPNSGMAVTIDIGDPDNIHPKNKFDVGNRLALWALAKDYGQKNLVFSGPIYRDMKVEDGAIRISFDYTGGGLMAGKKEGLEPAVEEKNGVLKRFAVAGDDKRWHWADAKIDGDVVLVSSPKVAKPVAVRYAWSDNPAGCNLYNKEGLPASPFRTDEW